MSSTTDLSTLNINYLTQAQYDEALAEGLIEDNELYLTPSESKQAVSGGTDISLVTTGEKYTWGQKQNQLVSGTNIKTINNTSLLGSGNISIATPTVDQTYNASSTNAQSGVAVASAIAELPTPMQFKGSVGTSGTVTWTNLATAAAANSGYVYKVITDHSAETGKPAAKEGDTIVSNGSEWVVIPSGDEPSGTVTSIATGSGLSGGPITSSGTISLATAFGDTVNPYGSKTANYVLAAPNGEAGVPAFRTLVAADLPNGNWQNGSATGSVRMSDTSSTIGQYATAEGINSEAGGNFSHAEGSSITSGIYAHAEGESTLSSGSYSHSQNNYTIAQRKSQTAIGEYNVADTVGANGTVRGEYVFIVGNGTNDARSNAYALEWDGDSIQAGRATTKDMTSSEINTFVNNLQTGSAQTEDMTSAELDNFLQALDLFGTRTICPYDIGDIYETTNSANPNTKWNDTTWNCDVIEKDYIVDEGVTNGWTWKKYYSGRFDAWLPNTSVGTKTYNAGTPAWLNYTTTTNQFPFTPTSYTCNVSVVTSSAASWAGQWYINSSGYLTGFSFSSSTSPGTYSFYAYVSGTYKTLVTPPTIYRWRRQS